MTLKPSHSNQGFTLLEMLLVVAIIAVLAGIVVVAINPGKQLATVRNTERSFNLNEIHKAMQQYFIDHYIYPAATPTTLTEICNTGNLPYPSGIDCGTLIDLSPLVPTYLTSIPVDPQGSTLSFINNFIPKVYATTNGTGYKVMKDSDNKVVLTAPQAEIGEVIAIWTNTISSECPATGGTKTTSGNYCIHKFTTVGNDTFIVPSGSLTADVLVVAGGGGGGKWNAGGGGGGGVINNTNYTAAGNISVTVGAGGASTVNGSNSVFGTITSIGGGKGGWERTGAASNGGSGGGGGLNTAKGNGTVGPPRQGYDGSTGHDAPPYAGGGGGGAGAVGTKVSGYAGVGGAGLYFVNFASVGGSPAGWFGGGGGGNQTQPNNWGVGGQGGGGEGQGGTTDHTGTAGIANTGGGGGGGGHSFVDTGKAGGSGVVIVRYLKQI